MVIQSLTFPDLCWCFLLQHFFANLEDKMDQKHFEQFHTTVKIRSSVPWAVLLCEHPNGDKERQNSFLPSHAQLKSNFHIEMPNFSLNYCMC